MSHLTLRSQELKLNEYIGSVGSVTKCGLKRGPYSFSYKMGFPFQNNPKSQICSGNLHLIADLNKTDAHIWHNFGRETRHLIAEYICYLEIPILDTMTFGCL